jgi:hypothetical protein
MAKRKAAPRKKSRKPARRASTARRSAKRPTATRSVKRPKAGSKKAAARIPSKKAGEPKKTVAAPARKPAAKRSAASPPQPKLAAQPPVKVPRLDRARRILEDAETHTTPPSSLDMNERGSAARSGRAGMEHNRRDHRGMSDVTGGDPDVDVEDAYFAGEEAPGGDNPTPDQDIVEDIGKALGVTYNDNEELEGADKLEKRDKHRWELDPASSDDYKDRD